MSNKTESDLELLLLKDIFENLPIAMMIVDREGRILRMNKKQESQSRIGLDEVIGTLFHESWSILMEQQNFDEYYWNLLKNKIPYAVVFHDFKPQFFDVRVSGVAYGVPIETGDHFLLIHDVSTDIKTNKKTLDLLNVQLSQRSAFLRGLLDSSPHAVLTIDMSGFILSVNRTAEAFFGKSKGDLLWKSISELFVEAISKAEFSGLASGKSGRSVQCRKADGNTFPGKIKLTHMRREQAEKPTYLVILEDQTYEKAIESALSERLQFEMILSELFATFINPSLDDIGVKIDIALSRIGQQLDLDRCYLTLIDESSGRFMVKHTWANHAIQPVPVGTILAEASWVHRMLSERKPIQVKNLDEIPPDATMDRQYGRKHQTQSLLYLPLIHGKNPIGALGMEQVRYERSWNHEMVLRIKIINEVFLNVLQKKQSETRLQLAFEEIKQLKERLESERNYLLDEIKLEHNFEEIVGQSLPLKKMLHDLEEVAPTDSTVLILGETGTGKELIARAIHSKSKRNDRPLVKVNCASLPVNLIESELFGHEKGAFTGAHSRRKGRFETADGATLFLDEIGELPLETQSKLLRILQESEFERLGSSRTITVDIRIIAATNRNLEDEINAGRFRKDLWYRLNVFPILAPPLHERKGDIPLLVNWMVKKYSKQMGKEIKNLSLDTIQILEEYQWPGNIRELQNVIERAVIKSRNGILEVVDNLDTEQSPTPSNRPVPTLAENERAYIHRILENTGWKIGGKTGAAAILGLPPSTLRSKMKKLNIQRPV